MSSEESGSGYRKTHLIFTISARILHSFPYFFITLFPTAFFLHSKMTGTYLMPFRMKSFSYLLTLAPFVSFADTFPDKRGQLALFILSFCDNYYLVSFLKNYNFFFP